MNMLFGPPSRVDQSPSRADRSPSAGRLRSSDSFAANLRKGADSPGRKRFASPRLQTFTPFGWQRKSQTPSPPRCRPGREASLSAAHVSSGSRADTSPKRYFPAHLPATFGAFCNVRAGMDGKGFAKLCADCNIIDSQFTTNDADLVFAKVVPKGQRRINLEQFWSALALVAEKRGMAVSALSSLVAKTMAPTVNATTPEPVRLHEPKRSGSERRVQSPTKASHNSRTLSPAHKGCNLACEGNKALYAWTEIGVNGIVTERRSRLGCPRPGDLLSSELVAMLEADGDWDVAVRSGFVVKVNSDHQAPAATPQFQFSGQAPERGAAAPQVQFAGQDGKVLPSASLFPDPTAITYDSIIDAATFVDLCSGANLLDARFTGTDAAHIFAKVVPPNAVHMSVLQLILAVDMILERKAISAEQLRSMLIQSGRSGPVSCMVAAISCQMVFSRWSSALATQAGSDNLLSPASPGSDQLLMDDHCFEAIFSSLCGDPPVPDWRLPHTMDFTSFAKVCEECGAFDDFFTLSEAYAIFVEIAPKGECHIDSAQFRHGLHLVAQHKRLDPHILLGAVAFAAARQNPDCFRNVKSLSEAKRPAQLDPKSPNCRSQILKESDGSPSDRIFSLGRDSEISESDKLAALAVEATFRVYCGAQALMDGKTFTKLCHDCGFLDKDFKAIDADLIFAKVVPKTQRRIDLGNFCHALQLMGIKKNMDRNIICDIVASSQGPVLKATQPADVRFHDRGKRASQTSLVSQDSTKEPMEVVRGSAWVRAPKIDTIASTSKPFASIGPANGNSRYAEAPGHDEETEVMDAKTFVQLCFKCKLFDSSFTVANAEAIYAQSVPEGCQCLDFASFQRALKLVAQAKCLDIASLTNVVVQASGILSGSAAQRSPRRENSVILNGTAWSGDLNAVESIFQAFCGPKGGMDGLRFAKFCKDTRLLDKAFTAADADITFSKVLPKGARRITFPQLLDALSLVAETKGLRHYDIFSLVEASSGPILQGTCAEAVRFYDRRVAHAP